MVAVACGAGRTQELLAHASVQGASNPFGRAEGEFRCGPSGHPKRNAHAMRPGQLLEGHRKASVQPRVASSLAPTLTYDYRLGPNTPIYSKQDLAQRAGTDDHHSCNRHRSVHDAASLIRQTPQLKHHQRSLTCVCARALFYLSLA